MAAIVNDADVAGDGRDPASPEPLVAGNSASTPNSPNRRELPLLNGVQPKVQPANDGDKNQRNKVQPIETQTSGLLRCSQMIISTLERAAFKWGILVARRPLTTIIACFILTGISAVGLLRFQYETDPMKLWIPTDAAYLEHSQWIKEEFPDEFRHHLVIYSADNVLEPEALREVWWLYSNITQIKIGNLTWENFCAKIPQISALPGAAHLTGNIDPTSVINSGAMSLKSYCRVLKALPNICWARGLLELWDFDFDTHLPAGNSTLEEVLEEMNSEEFSTSPHYGLETNFSMFLGGIERDSSGQIISAKSTIMHFINQKPTDLSQEWKKEREHVGGLTDEGDPASLEWEAEFLRIMENFKSNRGASVSFKAERSFSDLSNVAIAKDVPYLAMSCALMYAFVSLNLGKFDCIENRIYLSIAGIASIYMAFIVSCGLCSAIGIVYSPVHNLLVLLLQGLGVDDMFVILKTWTYAAAHPKSSATGSNRFPLHYRMGLTMQSAGISITVTSLTDFAAFVIGGFTVLPCLRSFCAYAAVGILVTYLFQISFFLACFVLDQARVESEHNGCIPCARGPARDEEAKNRLSMCDRFFTSFYPRFLLNPPVKAMITLIGLGLVGFGSYGVSLMTQHFELSWFLPEGSYLIHFLGDINRYYPQTGRRGFVYWGGVNYSSEIHGISLLDEAIQDREDIIRVDSWAKAYEGWLVNYFPADANDTQKFQERFSQFLFSPAGAPFQRNFLFNGSLSCGDAAPPILASRTEFIIASVPTSADRIGVMLGLRDAVESSEVQSDVVFPWSFDFATWETDRFIAGEVLRNLLLAAVAILFVTVFLIANIVTSFWVLLCVAMTLVSTTGIMHFWGLTIEIVTSLNLILAIGLCVDYAAHIGHTFMTCEGTKDQRVAETLARIGPAVLSGGFSTFLSLSVLALSHSYVFMVFFRVFFLTCMFGLFYGLVFLPVMLSMFGPEPYFATRSLPPRSDGKNGGQEAVEYEFVSVV